MVRGKGEFGGSRLSSLAEFKGQRKEGKFGKQWGEFNCLLPSYRV
jgi:hypothetical protein